MKLWIPGGREHFPFWISGFVSNLKLTPGLCELLSCVLLQPWIAINCAYTRSRGPGILIFWIFVKNLLPNNVQRQEIPIGDQLHLTQFFLVELAKGSSCWEWNGRVLLIYQQALTGTRYPTRPVLFYSYPNRTRKFFQNFRVQGSCYICHY